MLTLYRRHGVACPYFKKPRHARGGRSCGPRCPIWVQGVLGIDAVRRSTGLTSWERATELIRAWETAGQIGTVIESIAIGASVANDGSATAGMPSSSESGSQNVEHASEDPPAVVGCVEAYLRDCQARNLAPAAIGKYRTLLKKHLLSFCTAHEIRDITELTLTPLRTFRETWTFAPITHAKHLERLRTFWRFCIASEWATTNPALILKPPKPRHHPTLPFEDEECARFLAAIERWRFGTGVWAENGRRVRALLLVLRYTGLRISDALILRRADVGDDRIFLYQAKTGLPVWVPVPAEVTAALSALADQGPYYFWRGAASPTAKQVEYAYQVWRRKLLALAKHAGVANARFHRFRDSFAVGLLAKGVALEIVSMLLGHASVKVTEKHYKPWVRQLQQQLEAAVRSTWD